MALTKSRPPDALRRDQQHYSRLDYPQEELLVLGPLDVFAVGSVEPLAFVNLEDVFINDKAVLYEVELLSRREYALKVSMRWEQAPGGSALAASLEFQLENANLRAQQDAGSNSSAPSCFNELLNHACTVSECFLLPGKRLPLVLVFHPCRQDPAVPATSFLRVRGLVHFTARRASAAELAAAGIPVAEPVQDGGGEGGPTSQSQNEDRDGDGGGEGVQNGQGGRRGGNEKRREERVLLDVEAKVCRSILSADITELQFLEAYPGASYVKEFSVWNKSEIPLTFRLVPSVWLSAESGVLACSDYDTGAPLPTSSTGRTIGAYAHLRVRVAFRPREVGQRDYRIFVENLNDVANTLAVDIITSVVSESHREGLRIQIDKGALLEGGSVLQFDECYTGVVTSRRLRVKNTTVMAMDVSLRSDRPGEVMFELEIEPCSSSSRRSRHRFLSSGGGSMADVGERGTGDGGGGGGGSHRRRRTDSVSMEIVAGAGGHDSSGRTRNRRSGRSEKRSGGGGSSRTWPSVDDEAGTSADDDVNGVARPAGEAELPGGAGGGGASGGRGRDRGGGSGGRGESFESLSEEGGRKHVPFGDSFSNRGQDRFSRREDGGRTGGNGSGDGDGLNRKGGTGSGSGSGGGAVGYGGSRNRISRVKSSSGGGGGGSGSGSSGGGGARGSGSGRGSDYRRNRRVRAGTMDDEDDEGEEEHEDDGDDAVLGNGGEAPDRAAGRGGSLGGNRHGIDGAGVLGADRDSPMEARDGSMMAASTSRNGWSSYPSVAEDDDDDDDDDDDAPKGSRIARHKRRRHHHHANYGASAGSGAGGPDRGVAGAGLCVYHNGGGDGAVCINGTGGGSRESGNARRGSTSSGGKGNGSGVSTGRTGSSQQRANNYIEELSLGPGVERTLKIHFCPASPALDAAGTAGYGGGGVDDDDYNVRDSRAVRAAGGNDKRVAATAREQRRGEWRDGGNREGASVANLAAARVGTKLTKQAFKLFFGCQEPRGQWDDALVGGDEVDAEGYARSRALLRRRLSVGSDVRQFSKNIAGRAMVCTSVFTVMPREVAFGNCNIGEYKSHSLEVFNLSDLPAIAIAHVVSKVVSCKPAKIEIPAHSRAEMKVEYVPRKINSKYRKTISIINCLNPHGNVDVEVTASNIDTHHVLYHSHFYKLSVNNRMRQQQVYFNHAVAGCPALRTFDIHNVWDRPLLFECDADTPEIRMFEMVGLSAQTGTPLTSAAVGATPSANGGGGGTSCFGVESGRDQFLKTLNWDGPAGDPRERGHYSRSKSTREVHHLLGPIRGMDLEMPHGSTRKYRSSCFIDTGRQKSEGSTAAVSATDVLESLRERGSGSEKVLTIGGGLNSGGDTVGTGPADRSCRSGNAIGAGASDGGTGLLTNTATGGSVGGPGLGLATVRTGGAGGGKNSNNLSLACGGDHTTWSLDELVDSFETDRFPRKWRRGCGVMNDNVNGAFTLLRGGLRRESGGPSDWSGGGTGGSEGRSSGPLRGAAPPEAAASWRTEREMRTLQVQFMRERMVQLRRAVEEGQLRPLGNRFFQVSAGKHTRIAVIMTLASSGTPEELQHERTFERHIHLRLLNVNASHLPPSLRRGVAASTPGGSGAAAGGKGRVPSPGSRREPLRVRSLLVRGNACRSEMGVAQKNINFGKVAVGEYATRTVVLNNKSPVPLFYSISKSMSISSGFLKIPKGGSGMVSAHRSKEVEFAFCPSLAGTFAESLSVTNVLDESNTQVITIKAKVYKPETFALVDPPEVMRLEPCLVGEQLSARPPGEARVLLRNATARRRLFVIEGVDAYSAATSAALGREKEEANATASAAAKTTEKTNEKSTETATPTTTADTADAPTVAASATGTATGAVLAPAGSKGNEGLWSDTSAGLTDGGVSSMKGGSLSPRPDAASRLRLSSAGSDITIGTDVSRPVQESGASMVLSNFAETTACTVSFRFTLDAVSAPGIPEVERQRMEEKLEHYLFKLRIAERKGREAKVAKMQKKIDRMRRQLAGETVGGSGDDGDETGMSESESDSDAELQLRERTGAGWGTAGGGNGAAARQDGVGRLELSLDGDSEVAVSISVSFTPGASFQGWEGGHLFRGLIRLYESRNEDVVKELPCVAQVYSSASAYHAALQQSASPSVDEEAEDGREGLSPLVTTTTLSGSTAGGGAPQERKSLARLDFPPRSLTDCSSPNHSPNPAFFTPVSGSGFTSTLNVAAVAVTSATATGVGTSESSGSALPTGGAGGATGTGGGSLTGGSPRGRGLPEFLRQTMRMFSGGRDRDRAGSSDRGSEGGGSDSHLGDGTGGGVIVTTPSALGAASGGDAAGSDHGPASGRGGHGGSGVFAPFPRRPDRSPSPHLVASFESPPVAPATAAPAGVLNGGGSSSLLPRRRTVERTTSPSPPDLNGSAHKNSEFKFRRASYTCPGHGRPSGIPDLRGGGGSVADHGRSPPSPMGSLSDTADDVYDPGGGGSGAGVAGGGIFGGILSRRNSGTGRPGSPVLSDGANNGKGAAAAEVGGRGGIVSIGSGLGGSFGDDDPATLEAPFFATVAQFCTLAGSEEGTLTPGVGGSGAGSHILVGDGDEANTASFLPPACTTAGGGSGAVTPASLPALFPKPGVGLGSRFTLSEAVRMVLSSADNHDGAGTSSPGEASPGMFSLHSVSATDIIIKVSWDDESTRRLGILPVPSPAFLFRAESKATGGAQPAPPPARVQVAVLHAGSTLDVSVKLDGTVSVPVGRWCVGAVVVTVVDRTHGHHGEGHGTPSSGGSTSGSASGDPDGNGGGGGVSASRGGVGGGGVHERLLVPVVLEALPENYLSVPRRVDLGTVELESYTPSSFAVQNLSTGPAPVRFVVMVAGKPATNGLLLTNQQTGTLPPGGSVDVTFVFQATSVGRWTHELAVRNLGNKYDQAKVTVSVTVKPRMYLHFPDLDPDATFKPEKLQIGYCYMPGRSPGGAMDDVDAPETEIVRPLRVRNISDRKLFLSCIPNLRKQCFVYADIPPQPTSEPVSMPSTLGDDQWGMAVAAAAVASTMIHRPAVADLPLLPQSETTLYIGLRPVLPKEAFITGDCRELIGGVRIFGHSRALADTSRVGGEDGTVASEAPCEESSTGTAVSGGAFGAEPAAAAVSAGGPLFGPSAEAVAARQAADRLFELTIKFVGTVGVSILRLRGQDSPFMRLPPRGIDDVNNFSVTSTTANVEHCGDTIVAGMATTPVAGAGVSMTGWRRQIIYGSLDLENVTKALPLEYEVTVGMGDGAKGGDIESRGGEGGGGGRAGLRGMDESSALKRLQILPAGSAELVLLAAGSGTLPPSSRRRVRFCVLLHAFHGLFQREIAVENLSSSPGTREPEAYAGGAAVASFPPMVTAAMVRRSSCLFHLVRLFVDGGTVSLYIPPPSVGVASSASTPAPLASIFARSGSGVEDCLSDLDGNALPYLENLTVPVTLTVAPSSPSRPLCDAEAASLGRNMPAVQRYRVLVPFLPTQRGLVTGSTSPGQLDELLVEDEEKKVGEEDEGDDHDDEEDLEREDSNRLWSGDETFEMSPVSLPRRVSATDEIFNVEEEQQELVDAPTAGAGKDELEVGVTNHLMTSVILAPYSNLPLHLAPIVSRRKKTPQSDADGFAVSIPSETASRGWELGCRQHHGKSAGCCIDEGCAIGCDEQQQSTLAESVGRDVHALRQSDLSMVRCGPTMRLAPNATQRFRLGIRSGALTGPLPTADLESGKAVPFDGFVAFARVDEGVFMSSVQQDVASVGEREQVSHCSGRIGVAVLPEVVDFSHESTWPCVRADSQSSSARQASASPRETRSLELVKLVRAIGTYCRPKFEVVGPAVVDLGKVGHTVSKSGRRRFALTLRNISDTPVPVGIAGLSPGLEVMDDRSASPDEQQSATYPPVGVGIGDNSSRRTTGRQANSSGGGIGSRRAGGTFSFANAAAGSSVPTVPGRGGLESDIETWIPARAERSIEFQLRLSRRRQSWAGVQTFTICLLNLADPQAEDIAVAVHARVVTHLVSILGLDEPPPSPMLLRLVSPGTPNYHGPPPPLGRRPSMVDSPMGLSHSSALGGFGSFGSPAGGSVRLAPLAIPPLRGAAGRCTGSFQVRNVSDEPVSVMVRVEPAPEVAGVLSLGAAVQQQDSSNGVYALAGADGRPSPSISLLPGDVLDVQVECLALPGARLPPDLLPPMPQSDEESAEMAAESAAAMAAVLALTYSSIGSRASGANDWDLDARLIGTVRVEIALDGRLGEVPGALTGAAGLGSFPAQAEGVLIESVALIGSLVPGPTFGLSRTSIAIALRPPESGGGGGGRDGTGPFDPEGPASFFIESSSGALGPVRFKLAAGGRLRLARGVRVVAADDEGGGSRRPARVAQVVTVVAEPSRGIVSVNGRREVIVRLAAAPDNDEQGELFGAGYDSGTGELIRHGDHDAMARAAAAAAAGMGPLDHTAYGQENNLFVIITDTDNPGYPPQVVAVHVELPPVLLGYIDPRADVSALGLGASGEGGGVGVDGSIGSQAAREPAAGGSYRLSNGTLDDESASLLAEEIVAPKRRNSGLRESQPVAELSAGSSASDAAAEAQGYQIGSGAPPPASKTAAGGGGTSAELAAKYAAATAAAIAAGPHALVPSWSDASMLSSLLPRLELRGCTPIGPRSSRFELNLGQQIAHPSSIDWEVSVIRPPAPWSRRGSPSALYPAAENWRVVQGLAMGGRSGGGVSGKGVGVPARSRRPPLDFRLYTLHQSDAEWLTLGQKEGQLLEAESREVTLYFNRSRVGVFSTYMVVENLANPADFKFVRVEMEVVDSGLKDGGTQLFEVLVSPKVPSSTREPLSPADGRRGSNAVTANGSVVGSGGPGGDGRAEALVGLAGRESGGGAHAFVGEPASTLGSETGKKLQESSGGDSGDVAATAVDGRGKSVGGLGRDAGGRESGGRRLSLKEPLVLDYGDVYEGMLYQRRSFVIVNHASMPLEFQLSSSLPVSELNFSLSAVTLKQFKAVNVEAKTRLQVFAHYRPVARRMTNSGDGGGDMALAENGGGGSRGYPGQTAVAVDTTAAFGATAISERLSITCRLVKDFQQEVQLVARRHAPQLRLRTCTHDIRENGGAGGGTGGGGSSGGGGSDAMRGDSLGILFVVKETSSSSVAPGDEAGRCSGGDGGVAVAYTANVNGELSGRSNSSTNRPSGGSGSGDGGTGGGVEVDGKPSRFVTVTNLRPRRRVVIAVVNVSMYFSVTPVMPDLDTTVAQPSPPAGGAGGGDGNSSLVGVRSSLTQGPQGLCGAVVAADGIELFEVPAGESLTLRVTPRLEKLRSGEGLALLANEQSLEEHFMVYNRRHPTEQYRVSLKLTSGTLRTFFLSPGSKNAHPFWTLEDKITTFLQAYQWMWREILETDPQLKEMLSEKDSGVVASKESGLLVFQRALGRLDVAMVAAGEPKFAIVSGFNGSVVGGGIGACSQSLVQSGAGSSLRPSTDAVVGGTGGAIGVGASGISAVARRSSQLMFEMFYLTDELLYYALKHEGFVGEFALRLANLVYSVVFRHEVFRAFAALPDRGDRGEEAPVFLRRWAAHLNHFLGYFPYPKPVILPLVELRRSMAPCFAPLPAGERGRAREGAPTPDDAPSPPFPSAAIARGAEKFFGD